MKGKRYICKSFRERNLKKVIRVIPQKEAIQIKINSLLETITGFKNHLDPTQVHFLKLINEMISKKVINSLDLKRMNELMSLIKTNTSSKMSRQLIFYDLHTFLIVEKTSISSKLPIIIKLLKEIEQINNSAEFQFSVWNTGVKLLLEKHPKITDKEFAEIQTELLKQLRYLKPIERSSWINSIISKDFINKPYFSAEMMKAKTLDLTHKGDGLAMNRFYNKVHHTFGEIK